MRGLMVLALASPILLSNQPARTAERPDVRFEQWEVPQGTMPFVPHDPAFGGWYAAFGANTLGRIDPATGQVKEFPLPTPDSGPHGLVADRDGRVWYTGNRAGLIGRADPQTNQVKAFASPGGTRSGPYSVAATDGVIWYTESEVQPNVPVRFDLKSETTQTWPVPARGGVVRQMVATGDSTLWLACSGTGVVVRARVMSTSQDQ